MNITIVELLVLALAVWETIEIWRHSAIAAPLRARAELMEGFFGSLLTCPFCLSPWVSLLFVIPMIIPTPDTPTPYQIGSLFIGCFSVIGIITSVAGGVVLAHKLGYHYSNAAWKFLLGTLAIGLVVILLNTYVCATVTIPSMMTGAPALGWIAVMTPRIIMLALAVARLANLGNDFFHEFSRTPHDNSLDLTGDKEPDDPATT